MKYLMIFVTCLAVSACSSEESKFTNNKTLWDKNGCAFIARHNIGSNILLIYSSEWSLPACNWEEVQ